MAIVERTTIQLVLVVYYIQSLVEIERLVADFEQANRLNIASVVVVDNGGALPPGTKLDRIEVVPGDNSAWEFSGWLMGLDRVRNTNSDLTILLNDSYRRNWTIEWPGRHIISMMVTDARRGLIAGWLDNFTRTSRRVNSRVVVMPTIRIPVLSASIGAAIHECRERQADGKRLWDAATETRLNEWILAQGERWDASATTSRFPRVFIEHHLFDSVTPALLSLRPRTWLGSQIYGITRKLAGERR